MLAGPIMNLYPPDTGNRSSRGRRRPPVFAWAGPFVLLVLLTGCDQGAPAASAVTATPAVTAQAGSTQPLATSNALSSPTAPTAALPSASASAGQPASTSDALAQVQLPAGTATAPPALTASMTPLIPPTGTPTVAAPTPTVAPTAAPATASGIVYVFPVEPVSSTNYGPYHHDYPATDIFCPIGSRFVAPTGGVVNYVTTVDRWDPATDDPAVRGGLSVAIIGDDGVRYYGSHLSKVEAGIVPGVRVEAGQLLGLTGKRATPASPIPTCISVSARPPLPPIGLCGAARSRHTSTCGPGLSARSWLLC